MTKSSLILLVFTLLISVIFIVGDMMMVDEAVELPEVDEAMLVPLNPHLPVQYLDDLEMRAQNRVDIELDL